METAGSIAVNGDAGRPRHFLAASQKLGDMIGILFSKKQNLWQREYSLKKNRDRPPPNYRKTSRRKSTKQNRSQVVDNIETAKSTNFAASRTKMISRVWRGACETTTFLKRNFSVRKRNFPLRKRNFRFATERNLRSGEVQIRALRFRHALPRS